jgi:predicted small secreted protein
MKYYFRAAIILALLSFNISSPNAWAGTVVYGSGKDIQSAMADTIKKLEESAKKNRKKISSYPNPKECKQDNKGVWTCHGVRANHR